MEDIGLKAGVKKLRTIDWRNGENLWLFDVIALFGGADKVLQQLRDTALKGCILNFSNPQAELKSAI